MNGGMIIINGGINLMNKLLFWYLQVSDPGILNTLARLLYEWLP